MILQELENRKLKKTKEDPQKILANLKKSKEEVKSLQESGEVSEAVKVNEKFSWKNAFAKVEGVKVKDDEHLLSKSIKRRDKQKKQSKKKWDDRLTNVKKAQEERQKKRQENIDKRKKEKKEGSSNNKDNTKITPRKTLTRQRTNEKILENEEKKKKDGTDHEIDGIISFTIKKLIKLEKLVEILRDHMFELDVDDEEDSWDRHPVRAV